MNAEMRTPQNPKFRLATEGFKGALRGIRLRSDQYSDPLSRLPSSRAANRGGGHEFRHR